MKRLITERPRGCTLSVITIACLSGCVTTLGHNDKLSFAAIADCQYADIPSKGERLYRTCPPELQNAVNEINSQSVRYAVHLGDYIDQGMDSFAPLTHIANELNAPLHHVLGNHDFSVKEEDKSAVTATLGLADRYYTFAENNWRFIAVDGNDVSFYGWPKNSEEHAENVKLYESKYSGQEDWNGAIGDEQLQWLERLLRNADVSDEKAVIFSHFPVFPENPHNLWNAAEILDLLDQHRSVRVWMSAHNHDGNYGYRRGVHHINLVGMLDTEVTAYSFVELSNEAIRVIGRGRQPDYKLAFGPREQTLKPK